MPTPLNTTVHGKTVLGRRGRAKSLLFKRLVDMPWYSEAFMLSNGGCRAASWSMRGREPSTGGDMSSSTAASVGVMEPSTLSKTNRSFRQVWSGGTRQRFGRFKGDSDAESANTFGETCVNFGSRKWASFCLFDRCNVLVAFANATLSSIVLCPLLFVAFAGLVPFFETGCGKGDLVARPLVFGLVFLSAGFGLSDFVLLTGEGVVAWCFKRGLLFGVTGAGASTAFTSDGLGWSVAALLEGATKSAALSMTVSSNPCDPFASAPHNLLRKNWFTFESDNDWLPSAVIFASSDDMCRLRSGISELFGASSALEPEAVSASDIMKQSATLSRTAMSHYVTTHTAPVWLQVLLHPTHPRWYVMWQCGRSGWSELFWLRLSCCIHVKREQQAGCTQCTPFWTQQHTKAPMKSAKACNGRTLATRLKWCKSLAKLPTSCPDSQSWARDKSICSCLGRKVQLLMNKRKQIRL